MTHEIAIAPQEFLIVAAYRWFAVQCGAFSRGMKRRARRAWAALITVFALCAINGCALPGALALAWARSGVGLSLHLWGRWALTLAACRLALSSAPHVVRGALLHEGRREAREARR